MRNNNFLPDKTLFLKLDAVFVFTIVNILFILFRRHPKCFFELGQMKGRRTFNCKEEDQANQLWPTCYASNIQNTNYADDGNHPRGY